MKIHISTIELDILREIINMGMAKAADSLSVIAKDRVLMKVPSIEIVKPEKLPEVLMSHAHHEIAVQSDLKGDLEGKTFLIFTQAQADKMAEVCIGPEQCNQGNYANLRRSFLMEVANILTGSLSTLLANVFQLHIYGTPPVVMSLSMHEAAVNFVSDFSVFEPFILTISTQFIQSGTLVELPLLIVFDLTSVQSMLDIIRSNMRVSSTWLTQ